MRTPLRTRLAATVLTAIALLAGAAWAQPGAPGADTRQRLALPAVGRDKVLTEMRLMLLWFLWE